MKPNKFLAVVIDFAPTAGTIETAFGSLPPRIRTALPVTIPLTHYS
jgi:hypothetical protein